MTSCSLSPRVRQSRTGILPKRVEPLSWHAARGGRVRDQLITACEQQDICEILGPTRPERERPWLRGLSSGSCESGLRSREIRSSCVAYSSGNKVADASTILCNCIVDFIRCKREPKHNAAGLTGQSRHVKPRKTGPGVSPRVRGHPRCRAAAEARSLLHVRIGS